MKRFEFEHSRGRGVELHVGKTMWSNAFKFRDSCAKLSCYSRDSTMTVRQAEQFCKLLSVTIAEARRMDNADKGAK
jgi:hypothetical protein